MAERVESWRAADGTLHDTARKADEHSCRTLLLKALGNQGLVNAVMTQPRMVYDALRHIYNGKRSRAKE